MFATCGETPGASRCVEPQPQGRSKGTPSRLSSNRTGHCHVHQPLHPKSAMVPPVMAMCRQPASGSQVRHRCSPASGVARAIGWRSRQSPRPLGVVGFGRSVRPPWLPQTPRTRWSTTAASANVFLSLSLTVSWDSDASPVLLPCAKPQGPVVMALGASTPGQSGGLRLDQLAIRRAAHRPSSEYRNTVRGDVSRATATWDALHLSSVLSRMRARLMTRAAAHCGSIPSIDPDLPPTTVPYISPEPWMPHLPHRCLPVSVTTLARFICPFRFD